MFWLEFIPTIAMGLIGLALIRRLVHCIFPNLSEKVLDVLIIGLMVIVGLTQIKTNSDDIKKDAENQKRVEYAELALKSTEDKLKEANKKVSELEERMKDRNIPKDIRNQVIEKLSNNKGEIIRITSVLGDQEAEGFAKELHNVFKIAGWKVKSLSIVQFDGGPVRNIIVAINNVKHRRLANHIVSTFKSFVLFNNHPVQLYSEAQQEESFRIIVGTKTISP